MVGDLIERGVKAIDKENTHYQRRGEGNFFLRMNHIIVFTVVARKPGGGYSAAYATLANDYGSWAIATLWSPHRLRWPDVKGIFRKKKK